MRERLTAEEKKAIKDFEVGETYTSPEGKEYKVLEVLPKQIICRLNNKTVKFQKILYAGVYAAMYFGNPLLLSSKITRATEE